MLAYVQERKFRVAVVGLMEFGVQVHGFGAWNGADGL